MTKDCFMILEMFTYNLTSLTTTYAKGKKTGVKG